MYTAEGEGHMGYVIVRKVIENDVMYLAVSVEGGKADWNEGSW